jgi:PPOX class probable F420-dependent enzyme
VWFFWDGSTILIFSRRDGYKLKHINNNPNVSLNLDSDGRGGNIVVFLGEAHIEQDSIPTEQLDLYLKKYDQGLNRIGITPEEFKKMYSSAIRITLTALRGH